jgi:hypothetical protein
MRRNLLVATILSALLAASPAAAKVIYVDNRLGDDINDGSSPTVAGLRMGPVRSLERARLLAGTGDIIDIANTGDPYYDSLRLIGGRASGVPNQPFIVNGNGATLDGSELVDPTAWEHLGGGLWILEPVRKGWFVLVRGREAGLSETVPETPAPQEGAHPNPSPGHWTAWRGAIYYRALPDEIPPFEPYRIATREAGLFLYGVRHAIIRDLRLRHFRLDGVNAHDQAYDVLIEGVVVEHNGRSGFFIGGSSNVTIRDGGTLHNRDASLLLREQAKANLYNVSLDAQPTIADD